jgi:hypothetical protein
MSLLTFSFTDEDPDFVFKCPVRCLTEQENFLRVDIMRRRINSRCKGLLEVPRGWLDSDHDTTQSSEFQPENFSNGRGKGPFKNMTVQYLHRTVKDFLARPDVWNSLLKASPIGYNPRLSICRGLVAQLKHMDPETLNKETFWGVVKLCIHYAKLDSGATENFVSLLKELDNSASKLANVCRRDGSSFLSRYSHKPGQRARARTLYPHWTSTFDGYEEHKGLTFLSLAVKLNLGYFVQAEANQSCLVMQDSGLWSLLYDSITCEESLLSFFNIRSFPSFDMVKLLLRKGADPNWKWRLRHSVFDHLAEQMTSRFDARKSSNPKGWSGIYGNVGVPRREDVAAETLESLF